jgi:hypothetical protein
MSAANDGALVPVAAAANQSADAIAVSVAGGQGWRESLARYAIPAVTAPVFYLGGGSHSVHYHFHGPDQQTLHLREAIQQRQRNALSTELVRRCVLCNNANDEIAVNLLTYDYYESDYRICDPACPEISAAHKFCLKNQLATFGHSRMSRKCAVAGCNASIVYTARYGWTATEWTGTLGRIAWEYVFDFVLAGLCATLMFWMASWGIEQFKCLFTLGFYCTLDAMLLPTAFRNSLVNGEDALSPYPWVNILAGMWIIGGMWRAIMHLAFSVVRMMPVWIIRRWRLFWWSFSYRFE